VKYREVSSAIETKVPGETGSGKESNKWIEVDGKRVGRVTYPKVHSKPDIPKGTLGSIQKQLRLTKEEFAELVGCTLSRTKYVELLREQDRKLIEEDEKKQVAADEKAKSGP